MFISDRRHHPTEITVLQKEKTHGDTDHRHFSGELGAYCCLGTKRTGSAFVISAEKANSGNEETKESIIIITGHQKSLRVQL